MELELKMDEEVKVETVSEEKVENDVKDEPVAPKKKVAAKRRGRKAAPEKRKAKEKPVEYMGETLNGVEFDDEGRLRLKEQYYYALTVAEQQAKICERDLEVARLKEIAYRKEIDSRLPPEVQRELAARAGAVQEANTKLAVARKQYRDEAKSVEEATGLVLKKWLVDDMRRMRHVDKLE